MMVGCCNSPKVKLYCEHSALTKAIKKLNRNGKVMLMHFPYDLCSHSPKKRRIAIPSTGAQHQDLRLPISDLPGRIADYSGSSKLAAILRIIGDKNRQDALHIDTAFKNGCAAFITCDSENILIYRVDLEQLLGIRFFHPDQHSDLEQFVDSVVCS